MKSIRPMITTSIRSALLVASLSCAPVPPLRAANPTPPVLNLQISQGGDLRDESGQNLDLIIDPTKVRVSEGAAEILGGQAVKILYDEKKALFKDGPFTWILKCKLRDPQAASLSPIIAGRWEVGPWKSPKDYRVVALGLVAESGKFNFMISPEGTADSCIGRQSSALPSEQWIQVVARYKPGSFLGISLYDENGESLFKESVLEMTCAHLFAADVDFLISAGPDVGFVMSGFRVWNEALAPDQIEKAVTKK